MAKQFYVEKYGKRENRSLKLGPSKAKMQLRTPKVAQASLVIPPTQNSTSTT
jgi:hypothetical protein